MVRTRIAPSPTGIPHIGNTRTALYNYLFAKQNKGRFIVRIEDTDRERYVPGSLEKILKIFKTLGLNWDEGPETGGEFGPYVQSQRLKLYQQKAKELIDKEKAYYCFCDKNRLEEMRKLQQKNGQIPRYDRKCLSLSKEEIADRLKNNEPHVVRFKIPADKILAWQDLIQGKISFNSNEVDDQVILKSDGYPTYHLAVVVDDCLMKISHVLRGVEWISSTPKHILLYEAFGWLLPVFGHLPIILGPDKAKLSKRHGAKSALDYQKEGYLPEAIINFMAYLGWSYKDNSDLLNLEELIKAFDIKKVGKANPIFDINKLNWFNGQWIRKKSGKELASLLKPYLKLKISEDAFIKSVPLIKERLRVLTDVNDLLEFLKPDLKADPEVLKKQTSRPAEEIKILLNKIAEKLDSLKNWQVQPIEEAVKALQKEYAEWKTKEYFMILRVAITCLPVSPPLFESIELLGKKLTLYRIKEAIERITEY